MKDIARWIKRIVLFLSGIALVVWGYKANAANNAKIKDAEKAEKEKAKPETSIFGTIELNGSSDATQVKASTNETVIESDKKAEESSGTE